MRTGYGSTVLVVMFLLVTGVTVRAEQLVTLETRKGVSLNLLVEKSEKPAASVILFAGGHGNLEISNSSIGWGRNNFLVRTRSQFANAGLNVVLVDAPSDRKGNKGMLGGFRASPEHVQDIDAVISYTKTLGDLPVWLVGTSRGTESAAYVATRTENPLGGVVLTSSISESNSNGTAVTEMALDRLKVPVLVTAHRKDGCKHTPADGAERIRSKLVNSPRAEVHYFEEGSKPQSEPCQALSYHGYLGIESQVVSDIVAFIKASGPANR